MHVTHQCRVFSRREISRTGDLICVSWSVATRCSATAMATPANSFKKRLIHTRLLPLIPVSPTPGISSYSSVLPWNYAVAHHLAPRHSVHFRYGGIVMVLMMSSRALTTPSHALHSTTPQLHFMVRCYNDPAYGTPTVQGYVDKFSRAFRALFPEGAAAVSGGCRALASRGSNMSVGTGPA